VDVSIRMYVTALKENVYTEYRSWKRDLRMIIPVRTAVMADAEGYVFRVTEIFRDSPE